MRSLAWLQRGDKSTLLPSRRLVFHCVEKRKVGEGVAPLLPSTSLSSPGAVITHLLLDCLIPTRLTTHLDWIVLHVPFVWNNCLDHLIDLWRVSIAGCEDSRCWVVSRGCGGFLEILHGVWPTDIDAQGGGVQVKICGV